MTDPRVLNLKNFPSVRRRGAVSPDPFLPSDVVRVDRGTPWGNTFIIGDPHPTTGRPMTRHDVVTLYREFATQKVADEPGWLEPLIGKRLACWCVPLECHAFVLIELREGTT